MAPKVKIYTRTGDKGETSLYGGKRILKSNQRVAAYGAIDELNCLLGMVAAKVSDRKIIEFINSIQEDLFTIGARLAGAKKYPRTFRVEVKEMENYIDEMEENLSELRNFILPGGGEKGALIHLCRSVARRAEREVVKLSQKEEIDGEILIYLNRLSDFLFVLARYINSREGKVEKVWMGIKN